MYRFIDSLGWAMVGRSDFDLISLLYGFLGLDTAWRLRQQWSSFWDSEVTQRDRLLAQRVALFLMIPLGVFFHEGGHALATWQVGGQVIDFQWRIFWGYVTAVGNFSPLENWWISLSGNIVSIGLGLLAVPAFVGVKQPILKQVLLTFAAAELVYSTVFYPIFSFMSPTFVGDWVTIYDFSVRPYAQIMLALHLSLLATLWYLLKIKKITQYATLSSANIDGKPTPKAPESPSTGYSKGTEPPGPEPPESTANEEPPPPPPQNPD